MLEKPPRVILAAAMSLDGKIALSDRHASDWSGNADKRALKSLLDSCDAVIVGRKTFKLAMAPLAKRNCLVLTSRVMGPTNLNRRLTMVNPAIIDPLALASARDHRRIALLGGTTTYGYFLSRGEVDEIRLTLAPKIIGQGLSPCDVAASSLNRAATDFSLVSVQRLDKDGALLLRYRKRG